MIKMIIAPLLFSTLVVGIAGTGDLKAMGRIGLKAIIYFEVATTIALFLGLGLVNFFQPGAGVHFPRDRDRTRSRRIAGDQGAHRLGHAGDALPDVACSTRWPEATSCSWSSSRSSSASASPRSARAASPVVEFLESVAQVMFKFTGYVMMFAPIGVMAAIAATVGKMGLGILFTLGKLVLLDVRRPARLRPRRASAACR